ncbi:MAG TPA: endonuclease/exonuclease/phosphatase family protein [Dermatophilaceae bacterium]|nr:endonuclease/exonuclease/phosphatase family protein [Dermatophilaceae bacterium]
MRRRFDVALAGVLVVLAVVGALRWVDTTAYPVVVLQTAGPFVVIGVALLAAANAALRRWRVLAATAGVLAVSLFLAVPPYFSSASPKATTELTVMTANLQEGRADAAQVMDAVRAHAVDVIVLVEVTPEAVESLRKEGLDEQFSASAGEARADSIHGTLVYSRFPIEAATGDVIDTAASLQPEVTLTVDGRRVNLKAVHAPAPLAGEVDRWREGLRSLARWEDGRNGPVLLVGDFNADSGHPGFRALTRNLSDSHRAAGLGWVRTWPFAGHRMPPYVQLGHLLSRDLTVVTAGQVAVHGTDHAIIWASYAFTRGG